MRSLARHAVSVVGVLILASQLQAQFFAPPGYRRNETLVLQVRNGPFGTLTLGTSIQQFGPGGCIVPPGYVSIPVWGTPIPVFVPVFVPPPATRPQIVIQNIVQQPQAIGVEQPKFPNEFNPNPGRPMAKAAPARPADPQPAPRLAVRADADRAIESGRIAFSAGQYGRALELFRRAAEINPNEPSIQFLLSQTYFAIGKYREAVASISAGITLRADWADARYSVRELYWKNPEAFEDHMKTLREAIATYPENPALQFLLAHQLWFDGKKVEAQDWLRKVRALDKNYGPAATFK